MRRLFAAIVPLLACLCLLMPRNAGAQDITHLDMDGLRTLLAQNRGSVVMLNFFATWCPPCRAEIAEISRIYPEYAKKGLVLVGLSVDEDKAKVPPFVQKQKMSWPVYTVGADIAVAYGVRSIPHNAIYGRDGKLLLSEAGVADEQGMRELFDKLLKED